MKKRTQWPRKIVHSMPPMPPMPPMPSMPPISSRHGSATRQCLSAPLAASPIPAKTATSRNTSHQPAPGQIRHSRPWQLRKTSTSGKNGNTRIRAAQAAYSRLRIGRVLQGADSSHPHLPQKPRFPAKTAMPLACPMARCSVKRGHQWPSHSQKRTKWPHRHCPRFHELSNVTLLPHLTQELPIRCIVEATRRFMPYHPILSRAALLDLADPRMPSL